MTDAHPTMYRIFGRRQIEVNTDPQRRCYWGVHAKSEMVWQEWGHLGSVKTEDEAKESVSSWKELNSKHHEYKYEAPA